MHGVKNSLIAAGMTVRTEEKSVSVGQRKELKERGNDKKPERGREKTEMRSNVPNVLKNESDYSQVRVESCGQHGSLCSLPPPPPKKMLLTQLHIWAALQKERGNLCQELLGGLHKRQRCAWLAAGHNSLRLWFVL